mmetsp:Transcript_15969/g.23923  ORF Transcript_15969/g.23923 Transcript_15969/m.23923 type:complete len:93 (-) Transcript_15969:146-424(-)
MVHDECKLHPSFPFFGLWAGEENNSIATVARWDACPSGDSAYEENGMTDPEEGHVVVVITGVRWFPPITEYCKRKDKDYLQLGNDKFLLAGP